MCLRVLYLDSLYSNHTSDTFQKGTLKDCGTIITAETSAHYITKTVSTRRLKEQHEMLLWSALLVPLGASVCLRVLYLDSPYSNHTSDTSQKGTLKDCGTIITAETSAHYITKTVSTRRLKEQHEMLLWSASLQPKSSKHLVHELCLLDRFYHHVVRGWPTYFSLVSVQWSTV